MRAQPKRARSSMLSVTTWGGRATGYAQTHVRTYVRTGGKVLKETIKEHRPGAGAGQGENSEETELETPKSRNPAGRATIQ